MLESLRELQSLKVATFKHRISHAYACPVERSETSLILFLAPLPENNQRFFASLRMTTTSFRFNTSML
jgi:hypothetical protein